MPLTDAGREAFERELNKHALHPGVFVGMAPNWGEPLAGPTMTPEEWNAQQAIAIEAFVDMIMDAKAIAFGDD